MNRRNKVPPTERRAQPNFKGMRDINQQVLVLQGKTLIAVPEDENVTPVSLKITPCRDDSLEKGKGDPIYLGIADHNLSLCCIENEGQPVLKLEERDPMELYKSPKAEIPFVFYRNAPGFTSTFESAAYPGWFICTSVERGKTNTNDQECGKI
ncbi:interleukin-36 alpha-like isoform X2 [Macrotis lagotis]|uniref:interleukin-36 alpha-like isoform X2 n=1 Tax=Macrotis lagotis TaxID=92651 RepID=UPI003D684BA4